MTCNSHFSNLRNAFIALGLLLSFIGTAQEYQLNGNLGLGISPEKKLDVDGETKLRGDTEVQGELRLTSLAAPSSSVLDNIMMSEANGRLVNTNEGDIMNAIYGIDCSNSAYHYFWVNNTNRTYICNENALVGIGTQYPTKTLEVNGTGLFSGASEFESSLDVGGTFSANGVSLYAGSATFNDNVIFNGMFNSNVVSSFSQGLAVQGSSSFGGELYVSANSEFSNGLNVSNGGLLIESDSDPTPLLVKAGPNDTELIRVC